MGCCEVKNLPQSALSYQAHVTQGTCTYAELTYK